jgi:hypothetical protein
MATDGDIFITYWSQKDIPVYTCGSRGAYPGGGGLPLGGPKGDLCAAGTPGEPVGCASEGRMVSSLPA